MRGAISFAMSFVLFVCITFENSITFISCYFCYMTEND